MNESNSFKQNVSISKEISAPAVRLGPFVTALKLISTARPGDLVEIDRTIYAHWAVYIGKGDIIHVSCENLDEHVTQAMVEKDSLIKVAGESLVRVNNKQVPARKRGLTPLKWKKMSQSLMKFVGQRVNYNILTRNAEHFVTEWKFGTSWSDQANSSLQVMTLLTTSPKTTRELHSAHTAISRNIKTLLQCRASPTHV